MKRLASLVFVALLLTQPTFAQIVIGLPNGHGISTPTGNAISTPATAGYTFTYYIAPSNGGTLGNDTHDGLAPTVGGGHGPWTIGTLLDTRTMSPTAQQIANNAAMAGKAVCMVGDQGVLSLADIGLTYPTSTANTGMVLTMPNGTDAAHPTVLASCNSSGQYVQGLAVVDGGITTATINGMLTTNILSTYYMLGRFSLTSSPFDSEYMTIDGLEVRNAIAGGIVFGQSDPTLSDPRSPGWAAKNNYVHNIYNANEGSQFTGSVSAGIMTVSSALLGTVNVGDAVWNQASGAGYGTVAAYGTGGTSGTGGLGTYSIGGSSSFSGTISTTNFAGNNLAGISFHGGANIIQTNNFIQDIVDLNTGITNGKRSFGIKNWTTSGGTVTFNTVYATAATGYPTGGIVFKNNPQVNYTIANNYIDLHNAVASTGVDVIGVAGDGEGSSVITPDGSFATINNNIVITNPHGPFGFPGDAGANSGALIVNWYNNTMIGTGSSLGGFVRLCSVVASPTPILTYHDNILDRANPPAGGNGGDWHTQFGAVVNIDYDIWPSNYLLTLVPNTGGTITQYSAIPAQNSGISGAMAAMTGGTTGLEAHVEIGTPTYTNANSSTNFTNKAASDWKIAPSSPFGHGTGTSGNDKGAWGGQTQVGCNFKNPSG